MGIKMENEGRGPVECPECGTLNPLTAMRCDCGFVLDSNPLKWPVDTASKGGWGPRARADAAGRLGLALALLVAYVGTGYQLLLRFPNWASVGASRNWPRASPWIPYIWWLPFAVTIAWLLHKNLAHRAPAERSFVFALLFAPGIMIGGFGPAFLTLVVFFLRPSREAIAWTVVFSALPVLVLWPIIYGVIWSNRPAD